MEFSEARDLIATSFKEAGGCNYEGDGILVVGTNSQSAEVHIRESGNAVEVYSKLNGLEGGSFFKHAKLAHLTADQAREFGKSSASFCFNALEKTCSSQKSAEGKEE